MGTNGKHRRVFTPEYRKEAAHLVIDTGRPVAHVAREVGLGEQLLGRWVRQEREAVGSGGELDDGERAELERLRKENAQLRMDVEFLGYPEVLIIQSIQTAGLCRPARVSAGAGFARSA
jgi:transposase